MDQVSVIVPVFNNRNTLPATLDSLLAQTYRPLQIVVVDDASMDGSYALAKAYAQQHQQHNLNFIVLKQHVNKGAGKTRNKALDAATGRYIAFLDADDLWKPHKLQLQLKALSTTGKAVCYSAYEVFDKNPTNPIYIQKVFPQLSYERLHRSNYLGNLTGIYDVSKVGKVPITNLRKRQDWAMWLDVLDKAGPAIGLQEPLASYRLSDGLSASKWKLIPFNYAVYRQHLGYSSIKSCLLMALFFYEQFFVKARMKKVLP